MFTAQASETLISGKLFPKIDGVSVRESFLDICVLEAKLQQGGAAMV